MQMCKVCLEELFSPDLSARMRRLGSLMSRNKAHYVWRLIPQSPLQRRIVLPVIPCRPHLGCSCTSSGRVVMVLCRVGELYEHAKRVVAVAR